MLHTDSTQTRSLTLVLPEAEWRALRDAEPDALGWLQRQIRERLSSVRAAREPEPEYDNGDDY
jgi:hypothetical protein